MHFSFYYVISHPFLVLLSSVGGRTFFYVQSYISARRSFIYILFYTREAFSCFLPLKDLNPSLFLPEPTYLSLPIFPLVLHRRESF